MTVCTEQHLHYIIHILHEQKLVHIVIHNIGQMHNYALREY
jgi:hypothetical protein